VLDRERAKRPSIDSPCDFNRGTEAKQSKAIPSHW
jgi:hypothetical protein